MQRISVFLVAVLVVTVSGENSDQASSTVKTAHNSRFRQIASKGSDLLSVLLGVLNGGDFIANKDHASGGGEIFAQLARWFVSVLMINVLVQLVPGRKAVIACSARSPVLCEDTIAIRNSQCKNSPPRKIWRYIPERWSTEQSASSPKVVPPISIVPARRNVATTFWHSVNEDANQ